MARRLIGIDLDGDTLNIAILLADKGRIRLLRCGHHRYGGEGLAATLTELAGGPLESADRLCLALPGGSGWVRHLAFPFREGKALTAALPLALAAQLPLPLEECAWASQEPQPDGAGARVLAAAVRHDSAAAALAPFDTAGLPLQTLDLAPFAVADGVRRLLPDAAGVLILAGRAETTLLRLGAHAAADYRLLPHGPAGHVPTPLIAAAARNLRGGRSGNDCPLILAGSRADAGLRATLLKELDGVDLARASLDGQPVPPQELATVAIALRGADGGRGTGFNFRRGSLAHRGAWARQRRHLIAAALLLGASLLIFTGAALTTYLHKVRRADALHQELSRRYRDLVPGSGNVVDPLLQLRSRMVELEQNSRPGGSDRSQAPLAILRELSRLTPTDLAVDLHDFAWSPDEVRIEGTTASFDAANRLLHSLQQSPLLGPMRLTDAKANADGGKVSFRLTLPLGTPAEVRR